MHLGKEKYRKAHKKKRLAKCYGERQGSPPHKWYRGDFTPAEGEEKIQRIFSKVSKIPQEFFHHVLNNQSVKCLRGLHTNNIINCWMVLK